MKICIIGHKGHGKDTVADLISKHSNLRCTGSSVRALEIFLFDILKEKHGYKNIEEAYLDRDSCRQDWFDSIQAYNTPDKTKLATEIMLDSDVYIGMRDLEELQTCLQTGVFDVVIGVLNPRKPKEIGSNKIDVEKYSDLLVINDGDLQDLENKVVYLLKHLGLWKETI